MHFDFNGCINVAVKMTVHLLYMYFTGPLGPQSPTEKRKERGRKEEEFISISILHVQRNRILEHYTMLHEVE